MEALCSPNELRQDDWFVVAWDDESGPSLGIVGQLKNDCGPLGPGGDNLIFVDSRTNETVEVPVDAITVLQPVDNPWNTPSEVEAQLSGCWPKQD